MIRFRFTVLILSLFFDGGQVFLENRNDAGNDYLITGKLTDIKSGWIFLAHADKPNQTMKIDSTKVVNGTFKFSGKTDEVTTFILGVHPRDRQGKILPAVVYRGPFILSPGHLQIEGALDWKSSLSAFGTNAQDEYNTLKGLLFPLNEKMRQTIGEWYRTKGFESKKLDSLNKLSSSLEEQMKQIVVAHILRFPNSSVSAYIAHSELRNADPDLLHSIYNRLADPVKASTYGISLQKTIQTSQSAAMGKSAPVFSIPDSKGNLFSLAANRGTYTLIDFWASWCSPCRRENLNLTNAYKRFRSKGFQVISISLDTDKALWLKAVEEDQLIWPQLSDLRGLLGETAKKYAINAIPMNFLLDDDGKIVARDLKGDQLLLKLEEIY